MPREDVEQRLLRRHPDLPAGVVLGVVARAVRRRSHAPMVARPVATIDWAEVERAADEQLLLRQVVRLHGDGFGDGRTSPKTA